MWTLDAEAKITNPIQSLLRWLVAMVNFIRWISLRDRELPNELASPETILLSRQLLQSSLEIMTLLGDPVAALTGLRH